MLLASGWQNSSKVFFLFKSRCPSILSVKGVYADVEEFVAIRDWVSIVSTSVQPRLRRSRLRDRDVDVRGGCGGRSEELGEEEEWE